MTRGPWCFRAFAGSWRFEPIGPGRTRASFTYRIAGRPSILTRPLAWIFDRDTHRRLAALKHAAEVPARPIPPVPGDLPR